MEAFPVATELAEMTYHPISQLEDDACFLQNLHGGKLDVAGLGEGVIVGVELR
jgi:hypothetical protein